MTEKKLILPNNDNSKKHVDYRNVRAVAKQFARRIRPLIENASLTFNQRKNIDRVIELECNRVFIDKKSTMEERMDFWTSKQMSEQTRNFLINTNIRMGEVYEQSILPLINQSGLKGANYQSLVASGWGIFESNMFQVPATMKAVKELISEMVTMENERTRIKTLQAEYDREALAKSLKMGRL